MQTHPLTCPNCGSVVTVENINIQQMTAVCPQCSRIFAFEAPTAAAALKKTRKIKQPDGVSLEEEEDGLVLSYPARRLGPGERLFVAGISGVSLAFLYLAILLFGEFSRDSAEGGALFFGSILLVIALGFLYLLLQVAFNRVIIGMDREQVYHREGPLPSLGNKSFPRERVTAFLTRTSDIGTENGNVFGQRFEDLCVNYDDGTTFSLMRYMDRDIALFMCQELQAELEASQPNSGSADRLTDDYFATDDAEGSLADEKERLPRNHN